MSYIALFAFGDSVSDAGNDQEVAHRRIQLSEIFAELL
jgi:hypothetical protein